MRVLIIGAQGGGIGKQLITAIKNEMPFVNITAVGTNSTATSAMLKAGAENVATGENPVIVGCKKADVIIGPIGIVIADSLWGEITPNMAVAVGQSKATRILIPVNLCENTVVGVSDLTTGKLIRNVIEELKKYQENIAIMTQTTNNSLTTGIQRKV